MKGDKESEEGEGDFEEDETAEYDNELDMEENEAEIHFDIDNLKWLKDGAQALTSNTAEA